MRQIKFRAKDLEGHWICGYYTQGYIHVDNSWGDGDQGEWWGIPVDENTVGQFTGLTDKNGKEIYEGDVLKGEPSVINEKDFNLYLVYFDDGRLEYSVKEKIQFKRQNHTVSSLCEFDMRFLEIIGSIHDNPELLTK